MAGQPLDGTADLEITLWSANSGGSQIGPVQVISGADVFDGLFSAELDFGATAFDDGERWLEIAVRSPAGSGSFTTLSPRQPVTAAPVALTALKTAGVDGHSLDAVDGSLENALFVDEIGNVGIGTESPQHVLDVNGNARIVGDITLSTIGAVLDQSQTSINLGINSPTLWQSFRASRSGPLREVVYRGNAQNTAGQGRFRLYGGVGTDGPLLAGQDYMIPNGVAAPISIMLANPPSVVANQTYTLQFTRTDASGHVLSGRLGDPYPFGITGVGGVTTPDRDLWFQTFVGDSSEVRAEGNLAVTGTVAAGTNAAIAGTLTTGGDVGIGTTTPANRLHILHPAVGSGWGIRIQNAIQSTFQAGMRVSNDGFFDVTNRISGGAFARLNSGGTWSAVSDRRMKQDIAPLDNADVHERALALEPVQFRYKPSEGQIAPSDLHIGFIAQDIQKQFPSLVSEGEDLLTLDYTSLSTVAIAALQQQQTQLDELRTQLEVMRAEVAALRGEQAAN